VDTAARPVTVEPVFHSNDFEEAPEYSSVSALAIASLVLGLASPLCLVSRVFLILTVLGIALSIFALVRIAASDGSLAGRWAAVLGLALCVGFGTAEISRGAITHYLRTSQARNVAQQWLEVLAAGKLDDAFQRTVEGQRPRSPLGDPGAPPPTTTPFDEFTKLEVIQRIAAAGDKARIVFKGTDAYQRINWRQFIVQQRFQIAPAAKPDGAKPDPFDVAITVQRSRFARESASHWLVWKYEEPTESLP
jgi:hypothetical protein